MSFSTVIFVFPTLVHKTDFRQSWVVRLSLNAASKAPTHFGPGKDFGVRDIVFLWDMQDVAQMAARQACQSPVHILGRTFAKRLINLEFGDELEAVLVSLSVFDRHEPCHWLLVFIYRSRCWRWPLYLPVYRDKIEQNCDRNSVAHC